MIFFGNLRTIEVETLAEKAKYIFIETCLALTIFRQELTTPVVMLFGSLIFVKLLHKLSKSRQEYLEQIAEVSTLAKVRMTSLLTLLLIVDGLIVAYCVNNFLEKGRSVLILFGFEFGLLVNYTLNLLIKFILQLIDHSLPAGLPSRGFYVMLVDLSCEVVKVVTYATFFCLVFAYYGLPIHLIRDLWSAYHSFHRKLVGFVKYLHVTSNLESRFSDATPEECTAAGNCLVCREEMTRGKKLPCGHIFHIDCIRLWLQHQQTCPLCRAEIPVPNADGVMPPAAVDAPAAGNGAAAALAPAGAVDGGGLAPAPAPAGGQPQLPAPSRPSHTSVSATSEQQQLQQAVFMEDIEDDGVYPKFYIVVSVESVGVFKLPRQTAAPPHRTLAQGGIVFVTARLLGSDGVHWLKIADGWMPETKIMSNRRHARLLLPLVKTNVPPHHPSPQPQHIQQQQQMMRSANNRSPISSMITSSRGDLDTHVHARDRERFLTRLTASPSYQERERESKSLAESKMGTGDGKEDGQAQVAMDNNNSSSPSFIRYPSLRRIPSMGSNKSNELLELQRQITAISRNMGELNAAMLSCQQTLSRLIQGKHRS